MCCIINFRYSLSFFSLANIATESFDYLGIFGAVGAVPDLLITISSV